MKTQIFPPILDNGQEFILAKNDSVKFKISFQATTSRPVDSWSAKTLPAGLSLNSKTGEITGTPSKVEKRTAEITAKNLAGSATVGVSFEIVEPIAITGLTKNATGSPQSPTITVFPASRPFTTTYDGKSAVPKDIGAYEVKVTCPANKGYDAATLTRTFTIRKGPPQVIWSGLDQPVGFVQAPTIETVPDGLKYKLTIAKRANPPTAVGVYTARVEIEESNLTVAHVATANFIVRAPGGEPSFTKIGSGLPTFGEGGALQVLATNKTFRRLESYGPIHTPATLSKAVLPPGVTYSVTSESGSGGTVRFSAVESGKPTSNGIFEVERTLTGRRPPPNQAQTVETKDFILYVVTDKTPEIAANQKLQVAFDEEVNFPIVLRDVVERAPSSFTVKNLPEGLRLETRLRYTDSFDYTVDRDGFVTAPGAELKNGQPLLKSGLGRDMDDPDDIVYVRDLSGFKFKVAKTLGGAAVVIDKRITKGRFNVEVGSWYPRIRGKLAKPGTFAVELTATNPVGSNKKTITVQAISVKPSIKLGATTLPYNGKARRIPFTVTPETAKAVVTYDGRTAVPTDVGTYKVVIKVAAGNDGTQFIEEAVAETTYRITKVTPTISFKNTTIEYLEWTYGESASFRNPGVGAANNVSAPMSVVYNGAAEIPSTPGKYTVRAVIQGTSNYNTVSKETTYTIKKQELVFFDKKNIYTKELIGNGEAPLSEPDVYAEKQHKAFPIIKFLNAKYFVGRQSASTSINSSAIYKATIGLTYEKLFTPLNADNIPLQSNRAYYVSKLQSGDFKLRLPQTAAAGDRIVVVREGGSSSGSLITQRFLNGSWNDFTALSLIGQFAAFRYNTQWALETFSEVPQYPTDQGYLGGQLYPDVEIKITYNGSPRPPSRFGNYKVVFSITGSELVQDLTHSAEYRIVQPKKGFPIDLERKSLGFLMDKWRVIYANTPTIFTWGKEQDKKNAVTRWLGSEKYYGLGLSFQKEFWDKKIPGSINDLSLLGGFLNDGEVVSTFGFQYDPIEGSRGVWTRRLYYWVKGSAVISGEPFQEYVLDKFSTYFSHFNPKPFANWLYVPTDSTDDVFGVFRGGTNIPTFQFISHWDVFSVAELTSKVKVEDQKVVYSENNPQPAVAPSVLFDGVAISKMGWDFPNTYRSNLLVAGFSIYYRGVDVEFENVDAPVVPGRYKMTVFGFRPADKALNRPNQCGWAEGFLDIVKEKPIPTVSISFGASTVFNGRAQTANVVTTPNGLSFKTTYNGSATAPINAGTYKVVVDVSESPTTKATTASSTLTITKAVAPISFSNTSRQFTGTAQSITVSTVPAGLNAVVTYGGVPNSIPTQVGSYAVQVTINNSNYTGTAAATFNITAGAPRIKPNQVFAYRAGKAISELVVANDPTNRPVTMWQVKSSTPLPTGLKFNTTTGEFSGTLNTFGTVNLTVVATGPGGSDEQVVQFVSARGSLFIGKTPIKSFGAAKKLYFGNNLLYS
jgi:hypothetical protein